jgi:hypothetical protein
MKLLVVMVTLTATVVSPAFAQTRNRQSATPPADQAFAQSWRGPGQEFTSQDQRNPRLRAARRSNAVYDTRGEYVGSDPDPFIRSQLLRDAPGRDEE